MEERGEGGEGRKARLRKARLGAVCTTLMLHREGGRKDWGGMDLPNLLLMAKYLYSWLFTAVWGSYYMYCNGTALCCTALNCTAQQCTAL